jgi:predicted RNase H-like nuclease (RuvC/YqgF family)
VTISRFLPILNLVGCFVISGVIFAQWLKESGLVARIDLLNQELVAAREQTAKAEKHAAALESDVAQLKESIEATAHARQEAEATAARLTAEHNEKMAEFATANEQQVKTWEAAITERDDKIRELNTNLTATRERLNQAIAKLKEAGAR